ncbi:MAG: hypothetical protein A2385_10215 [Bdellovibrionales bacterium RIFOXYB1_FULL_39_21]|nr:MAG: hypothetical protein A2385_10215 [Bdellovibrionales bacterium RIFOXYB1_FULL_39_21]OFZ40836.1 MAG: hypothetical protein A2485_17375 [Bdellovibrionales bacterium RIFOXYC12_FULL_39_17]OFZ44377.1 MAG: hypothetical protein A2404_10985 [Bdellovibrionales bacterium RIFOXYC1_FULL_39_130]OFZ74124.1 MAG: hypothetical protein A2560_03650 [Bdellovibrionales bacterium RIFOXYD1_FULL_39_84]HLE12290.1 endonuclease [Bacteriovoracaceae bacterium]
MKLLMHGLLLVASLLSTAFANNSYYPAEYQAAFENSSLSNNDLRQAIKDVLLKKHIVQENSTDILADGCPSSSGCYQHTPLGYDRARQFLFGKLHLRRDPQAGYYIQDVYCRKIYTNDDFRPHSSLGDMRIPESNVINCEHTWPQSKFNVRESKIAQVSDLHHLFPTDNQANSIRGNFPFAEVNGPGVKADCSASHLGAPINGGSRSEHYFEPPNEHKGNVARALFYFSVRYNMNIDQTQEYFLKKWHEEDPVDADEVERNDEVMMAQGNRNPFIDFPGLVRNISDF